MRSFSENSVDFILQGVKAFVCTKKFIAHREVA